MNRPGESKPRLQPASAAALCLALGLAALSASGHPGEGGKTAASSDALAAEIARWSSYLATHQAPKGDEFWPQIQAATMPVLTAAEKALADGRRLLALQRLAAVQTNLAATVYVSEHTGPESRDEAAFVAEWERLGRELRADLGATAPGAFERVRPAAVRAMAETATPQIRGFYDAGLEMGKSIEPGEGLFYLGSARAQREFAAFCRTLDLPAAGAAPGLRPLAHELNDLETKLLAAYRPPASIDRHAEFIAANATLNEARQLDAAGLRYGALLRYLEAEFRSAPLLPAPAADPAPLAERLAALERRLTSGDTDQSIGRLFLERAQSDLIAKPSLAEAIVSNVLPRYFAALAPASPRPVPPAPAVTVTLVRWPYT
ncbi:MAG TPA: hypothetical protein VGK26_10720 [Thermoanaerobaculia bacterium]|jgi:hypothetical protein